MKQGNNSFDNKRRVVGAVLGPLCAILLWMLPIQGINAEAHHLLAIIVDGCYGQRIERCFLRLTEEDVVMFEFPVAIGYNDVVELKALALVDGENADAVSGNALYGLAADGLFPFKNKSIDISTVVEREFVQLVVERTNVCTFILETFQLEDFVESFREFVERQVKQRRDLLEETVRKEVVEGTVLDEQFALDGVVAQHRTLVELDQCRLRQLVVRVGEQMQCLNKQTNTDRGIEPECFVADNMHLGNLFADIVGYHGYHAVGSHQDSYLLRFHPMGQ